MVHTYVDGNLSIVPRLSLIHLCRQLLGKRLVIHSHRVAIGSGTNTGSHRDPRQRIPRLVALLCQPRDHPDSGVMLVERVCQLVPCLRELLLQLEGLQRQCVPFVLKRRQEGGDRGQGRWSRLDDAGGLDWEEVFEVKLVAGDWVLAILLDVFLYQPFLEDSARLLRNDRLLRSLT